MLINIRLMVLMVYGNKKSAALKTRAYFIIIIIIMLSRLLFACGASTQFDLQGKPCIGRVKTPVV